MHYRIFSILVTFVCLFGCALTTAAQDVNNTDETEKPVILYSGTPKKYEIADIKVEGATVCSLTWKLQQTRLKATKFG